MIRLDFGDVVIELDSFNTEDSIYPGENFISFDVSYPDGSRKVFSNLTRQNARNLRDTLDSLLGD